MKKSPVVSVIIPAYESSNTIIRAINSVQNQNFNDFEIIVVDNGSSDDTSELVKNLIKKEPRLHLIRLENNQRPAGGRNAGVENSIGEYIAFLDADDAWLPGKLSTQVTLLIDHPGFDLIFTDSWIFNLKNEKKFRHSSGNEGILSRLHFHPVDGYKDTFMVSGPLTQAIYTKSFINMSTSLLRRDKFLQTGGFNQDRFGTEDIDFWVRFSRISKFIYWHQPTAECFQGEGTSKPGESWLKELIRYHRACLVSPDYEGLEEIARQNLAKIYRYLILDYGLAGKSRKAIRTFKESLDLGLNTRLCLYTGFTLLGPIPFRIGQWFKSKFVKIEEHSKPIFFTGESG